MCVACAGAEGDLAVDVLYDGVSMQHLSAPRVDSRNTHGTGCTLAAAIAAELAKGASPLAAVRSAKAFLTEALQRSSALIIGQGQQGPLNHGCVPLRVCHIDSAIPDTVVRINALF